MERHAPDPAAGLTVLHVVDRVSATNSQYNEHCLPMRGTRRITVCSLFPADVPRPAGLRLLQGDGSLRGCLRALRAALTESSYDVVHVHAPASGVLTLLVCILTGRSRSNLAFTMHNSWDNFRPRNRLLLHVIAALYPLVVVCGHAAASSMPRRIRLLAGRLEVVPNGVDLDRVDRVLAAGVASSEAPGPSGREVVSVGRLIPIKEPDLAIAAFVRGAGQDDHLTIIGDGPLMPTLTGMLQHAELAGRVSLTGVVPRDEVYPALARASVFVSTSRGEGLPVAVLEAMACSCPVVLSDIPPHREIARLVPELPLVEVGDVDGFANALRALLDLPAAERARRGAALRRCVVEHYSVQAMNTGYGLLYRRLSRVQHGQRPFEALESSR